VRHAAPVRVEQRRDNLVKGALHLARAVKVAYGPRGGTVLIARRSPHDVLTTRDGMTIACEVIPPHRVERLGASALRQAAIRVNEEVGDGTSTAILIAARLIEIGHKHITAGHDAALFVQSLRRMASCTRSLDALKIEVTDKKMLEHLALHTTRGDKEIAWALAEASMLVGKTGMVVVEDGKGVEVEIVPKQGMELDKGWESSDFSSDGPWQQDVCLVAVVNGTVTEFGDIAPMMEAASQVGPGNLPLLVISRGIYGEALQTMVTNHRKDVLHCCAVRCPGYGPKQRAWMDDLAALTQATVVEPKMNMRLKDFDSGWLGSVQQVTATADDATLVCFDDAYESIENRVNVLRGERERSESAHDREKLTERIAKLTDGFCLLRVGGVTEAAAKERRGRIEDALHAVRAALTSGVVPGAGMAYLWLAEKVKEGSPGLAAQALYEALREPVRALAHNTGGEPSVILQGLQAAQKPWYGWDAQTRKYRDLAAEPALVDPLGLVRVVVEAAVSVASTLLTADVAITKVGDP